MPNGFPFSSNLTISVQQVDCDRRGETASWRGAKLASRVAFSHAENILELNVVFQSQEKCCHRRRMPKEQLK